MAINGTHFNGAAPGARMVVDDVGNSWGGLDIPYNLATGYFPYSYSKGARIHTNSWGPYWPNGVYDTHSASLDQFMYDNQDFLVLFAAGNAGVDWLPDTPFGVSGAGASKNGVAVGASQNELSFPAADGTKMTKESWSYSFWTGGEFQSDTTFDPVNGLAYFSSRGPARDDFRIKPDIVCPGQQIGSVYGNGLNGPSCRVHDMSGTSMATPLCAGSSALIRQYFREGHFNGTGFSPSASLVKAVLLQSGTPITYLRSDVDWELIDHWDHIHMYPQYYGNILRVPMSQVKIPNTRIGYGLVDLSTVLTFPGEDRGVLASYYFNSILIHQGENHAYCFLANSGDNQYTNVIKATLVWTDPAGSSYGDMALVHDLDLVVVDESSQKFHYGNNFTSATQAYPEHPYIDVVNPNEQITVRFASAGLYTVRVRGSDITSANGQNYSLVVTGTNVDLEHSPCETFPNHPGLDTCPNNCSGFGNCSVGACVCQDTHYGVDCSMEIPVARTGWLHTNQSHPHAPNVSLCALWSCLRC
jgi:hypothetical protein